MDKEKIRIFNSRDRDKAITNEVAKVIDSILNEMLKYLYQYDDYWIRNRVSSDLRRVIEDLINGRAEIIIRKTENSLIIVVRGNYVTLEIIRNRDVIVQILNDFSGTTMKVPDNLNSTLETFFIPNHLSLSNVSRISLRMGGTASNMALANLTALLS
ncbi:hypothetical protein JCM14467A_14500 [Vulcanisaeta sp. JCM 14467]